VNLGKIGIWTSTLDYQPWPVARQAAAEIESLGFGALWFPEALRREALSNAAILLASTQRIVVATGIANIYARDPIAMAAGQKTIAAAFPDRFLLGVGVSHRPSVQARGHDYGKPVSTMRAYLDAMDAAPFQGAPPADEPRRILAALGPRMLELAKERSWGAHPYFVPVEHTRQARQVLGRDPLLAPEQAVVLETDPTRARAIARLHTKYYLGLTNYAGNLSRLGYSDADLAGEGSDRLVDDIVAWGDIDRIAARVQGHLRAGANHVSLQVLTETPRVPPSEQWRALAGALPLLI
jgi:probable F420-dependent oxidoreductase